MKSKQRVGRPPKKESEVFDVPIYGCVDAKLKQELDSLVIAEDSSMSRLVRVALREYAQARRPQSVSDGNGEAA